MGENGNDMALGYMMGQDSGGSGGNGGWGDSGIWGLLILALLFGRGFGFGGGGGFGGNSGGQCCCDGGARSAISEGFALNGIENGIRGIQQGLCDGFYAMNTGMLQGFNATQLAMMQGFNGVQGQLCNMSAQQAACCCETQRLIERGFCDVGYAMATNTNSIIQNQHNDTDRVIAKLDAMETARMAEKIDALRLENQTLKFQASQANQNAFITANQEAQTAELIRRLGRDNPVPAYVVPNPNCCYGNPLGVGYAGWGNQNGCGCGCGCAA